ncbi:MAG: hypothetical protein Q9225_005319 [Loekoesia sp. 1 TL-2023]
MPDWFKRKVERQNPDRCNKYNSRGNNSDIEGRNPKRPKLSTNAEPKERAPDFDEQQVKGGQVRNDQNPSTPKCWYYNTYGGCKKGGDCPYQHIDRRPLPPPLNDKTTWGSLDKERVLTREENIQDNDSDLWNVIMDERVRLQRDMEQAKKDGDFDDFHRKELDEIEIDDIKGALSGWQGRSVSSKAGGVNYEDDRRDFDEIFASIHKQHPNNQQQAIRDNCLDQIIWKSLNLQTRQLFTGKSFNHLSRYVLKSDPWISLNLLNSLLDLPDARTEKGKGWYLGVISDASDPVKEDYLRLYIGQSIQIARRVQHRLRDRYTQESFQYQTTRRSDKRIQFYPIDPRVPYIQMSRLKAEYMRSHPELKVADIECEDGEVFTNEELDEAKQVYRESLDEGLEDIYLQNANWQDEEQEDVVQ